MAKVAIKNLGETGGGVLSVSNVSTQAVVHVEPGAESEIEFSEGEVLHIGEMPPPEKAAEGETEGGEA